MAENKPVVDEEVELMKVVFKDGTPLLKAMRAVLLKLDPTEEEKGLVRNTFTSEALFNAVAPRFYPVMRKTDILGGVQDIWLGAEQMIYAQSKDVITQTIGYKSKSHEMTKNALVLLRDPDADVILELDAEKCIETGDDFQTDLLARNQYIRHIEKQLSYLWILANQEKKEEVQNMLKRDSAR